MALAREAETNSASGTVAVVKQWSVVYKQQSSNIVNCQRRSGGKSIEAWPSTGRSLQDISDMPLWLWKKKRSLNINLEVWRIGKHGRVFHVMLRMHAGGRTAEAVIESDDWDRASFMLQRRLCSRVTEKKDVKWSDNASTKPVILACLLSTEKNIDVQPTETTCIRQIGGWGKWRQISAA